MIRNKKDLKQYLEQDFKIFKDSPVQYFGKFLPKD